MMYVNPGAPVEHRDAIDTTYKRTAPKATTLGGLPQYDADESGMTLGVKEDGELAWVSGGSGGGVLVVNIDAEYSTLDKTWQEIHDALAQGTQCVTLFTEDDDVTQGLISTVAAIGPPGAKQYYVGVIYAAGGEAVAEKWKASSADGYPTLVSG